MMNKHDMSFMNESSVEFVFFHGHCYAAFYQGDLVKNWCKECRKFRSHLFFVMLSNIQKSDYFQEEKKQVHS